MTGLEILKAPNTTAGEIADIIAEHCPPVTLEHCDKLSCRECWLAWLTTGEPPKAKGPSDERTTPDEEGLHPNLAERMRKQHVQGHKEQISTNMLATDIYQAILLCEGGEIPIEQRCHLLESLFETYCTRTVSSKLRNAHFAAMDKVRGLFPFRDCE